MKQPTPAPTPQPSPAGPPARRPAGGPPGSAAMAMPASACLGSSPAAAGGGGVAHHRHRGWRAGSAPEAQEEEEVACDLSHCWFGVLGPVSDLRQVGQTGLESLSTTSQRNQSSRGGWERGRAGPRKEEGGLEVAAPQGSQVRHGPAPSRTFSPFSPPKEAAPEGPQAESTAVGKGGLGSGKEEAEVDRGRVVVVAGAPQVRHATAAKDFRRVLPLRSAAPRQGPGLWVLSEAVLQRQ